MPYEITQINLCNQSIMIEIKSEREVGLIKEAGRVVRSVLDELKKDIKPGITTQELDRIAEKVIKKSAGKSAFKGYRGFPANICTSINEQIVHGIPSKIKLKEGDILSIDVGVSKNGFFADAAITVAVGREIEKEALRLIEVAREALKIGIERAVLGNRLFDISYAIQSFVETEGCSVVRDFVGHGIGRKMHEEPEIPNFGKSGTGPRLKRGMVLAIEPMINIGGYEVEILSDRWTAVSKDRSLSAHFEHTICITDGQPEILA